MAATSTRLRVLPPEPKKRRDRTATHEMPSGLGGVFSVEVLKREGGRADVRIHMPGTEWHHWLGVRSVEASKLKQIVYD